ncbi:MAG: hypothetical protein R3C18_00420 [Planctomycetaceae bacterium]
MNESLDDEFDEDNPPTPGLSFYWDVLLPLITTGVPMLCFGAMRVLMLIPQKPGIPLPDWFFIPYMVMFVAGIISMAVLVLFRLGRAMQQLDAIFQHRTPRWRKLMVLASVSCLTIVDVICNIATAFPDGAFLLIGAVVFYGFYLALMYLAFLFAQVDAEFGTLSESG